MKCLKDVRVAFVTGTLGQGGAEKQLLYMSRALLQAGASIRVYSLTRGDYHESELRALGINVKWIGQYSNPVLRLLVLASALRGFRPHIVQATHFYVNLYVALLSPLFGAEGVGSIRNDLNHEFEENPFWGRLLLWGPRTLIANSYRAQHNAKLMGIDLNKVQVLPNALDLVNFDACSCSFPQSRLDSSHELTVMAVGRLVSAKRFERFISALALARRENKLLRGVIVGDGPERGRLENFARKNGLSKTELIFLGQSHDVPKNLKQADIFVQTSDHEGFPNVLLEAMAARLPVVTTPAGDSDMIIVHGQNGYVVPFDDINGMASHIVQLANSPQLRIELGNVGRMCVERDYDISNLAEKMLVVYSQIVARCRSRRLADALAL